MAGEPAHDIIEASLTLTRIGAINKPVAHRIPFARPVFQLDTGWTIGSIAIQASCKARLLGSARRFVQSHRELISTLGSGYAEDEPPQESNQVGYEPFGGEYVGLHTFEGRYHYIYKGVGTTHSMDGIWPATLDTAFAAPP